MTLVACPGEATGPTRAYELGAFNMDHAEKVARMEENVEFLRAVSAGGPVSFSGKYFAIDELDLAPSFVQRPLPIWMAGNPPQGATPPRVHRVLQRVARSWGRLAHLCCDAGHLADADTAARGAARLLGEDFGEGVSRLCVLERQCQPRRWGCPRRRIVSLETTVDA